MSLFGTRHSRTKTENDRLDQHVRSCYIELAGKWGTYVSMRKLAQRAFGSSNPPATALGDALGRMKDADRAQIKVGYDEDREEGTVAIRY